jgi:hypothetical protein
MKRATHCESLFVLPSQRACPLPAATFFSGMAEIKARNALCTCSADIKTFAISGSIMALNEKLREYLSEFLT